ncbi:hypothetical protein XBLMG947_4112 [Xanthomonas bromi]|uniref:Uncharacterized protein n=1 Tax=Xanthomonas bromi TaxID=56449 RepID=A0A1C3NSB2_9XANT|nr:transcriptional regulator [Xanthomonas bromi]PPV04700.1 hypothetical protein XbrCFBP1976_20875 [Xanthomonas bromi]SBV53292.1 hypothetical protein XBLMG947_4112 [Xanthomonas bromi]
MTGSKNLENWLHEKVGPAYDALKADPARAVTPGQVRCTLAQLLAEAAGVYPLPPEQREWVDVPPVGRELTPFDLADTLTSAVNSSQLRDFPAINETVRSTNPRSSDSRPRSGLLPLGCADLHPLPSHLRMV